MNTMTKDGTRVEFDIRKTEEGLFVVSTAADPTFLLMDDNWDDINDGIVEYLEFRGERTGEPVRVVPEAQRFPERRREASRPAFYVMPR